MEFKWFILAESSDKSEDKFFYNKSLPVLDYNFKKYKNVSVDVVYIYKNIPKKYKLYKFDKTGSSEDEFKFISLTDILNEYVKKDYYNGIILSGHAKWGGTEFFEDRKKSLNLSFKDMAKILKRNKVVFDCIVFDMCLAVNAETINSLSPYTRYFIGSAGYHGQMNIFNNTRNFFNFESSGIVHNYLFKIVNEYNKEKIECISLIYSKYVKLLINYVKRLKKRLIFNKKDSSKNKYYISRYDMYLVLVLSRKNMTTVQYDKLLYLYNKAVLKVCDSKKNRGIAIVSGWLFDN